MAFAETQYGKFFYFAPDDIGQHVASGDFWDAHFRPWIDRLARGSMMVDVGANIGFFTVYCARKGVWVWAFEPAPAVFGLLKRNVDANEVGMYVRMENVALYDKEVPLGLNPEWNDWPKKEDGKVDYENHRNSGGMSLVPYENSAEGSSYRFEARTLDSYDLCSCDLIKTDTQGADLRVLEGARETIEKYRPVVCFEIEHVPARLHGDTQEKYFQFFEELNYTVTAVNFGQTNVDYVAEAKK